MEPHKERFQYQTQKRLGYETKPLKMRLFYVFTKLNQNND